jgi:predicted transcriptional regulator
MTTQPRLLAAPHDRALEIGPRQLQIMRSFWTHGPGTVHDLRERLDADPPLAYTTLMSLCVRLFEKGLLTRRKLTDVTKGQGIPYIYPAALSEAEYTRRTIGRSLQRYFSRIQTDDVDPHDQSIVTQGLAELGMLPLADGQQSIASLLERAEVAEQSAAQATVKLCQAEERSAALERRAQEAERRTDIALRRVETLERQLNKPPKPEQPKRAPLGIIVEHRDEAGICRVCAQPAPAASARRQDDLRVCVNEACRQEARRRDNNLKQRRYNQRRRTGK